MSTKVIEQYRGKNILLKISSVLETQKASATCVSHITRYICLTFQCQFQLFLWMILMVLIVFLWCEFICQSVYETRGRECLSINDGHLWIELLQLVSWTSFHHSITYQSLSVFFFFLVIQYANLCVVLRQCMNVHWLHPKIIFKLVPKQNKKMLGT